ncbi:MAG: beta-lactamase induction signal transducer, partial [Acidobacteriota bacterium]
MTESDTPRPSLVSTLKEMGQDRSLLVMLLLGLAAGLPWAVLTGTLNAWFTETNVDVATIGVLSWIGLAYAFKFLWSPGLHRSVAPVTGGLGARRGWMLLFQAVVMVSLGVIALSDPTTDLPRIALVALVGVIASASQDIVIDAWRIEVARDSDHLDALSVIYQFGYRAATFIGGFVALTLAARLGWNVTFGFLAVMMALGFVGVALAQEPERDEDESDGAVRLGANLPPATRYGALFIVLAGWVAAFAALGWFMAQTVTQAEPPDARGFIRHRGPWIVTVTVLVPAIVAAILLRLDRR